MKKNVLMIISGFLFAILVSIIVLGVISFKTLKAPLAIGEGRMLKIEENTNAKQLASQLKSEGLIKSERIFVIYWKFGLGGQKVTPGYYEFENNISERTVADKIASGKIKLVKITIPEGWRVEQIGQRLAENKITNYESFVKAAKQYEGKLFPDTFYFNPVMEASDVIAIMQADYKSRMLTAVFDPTDEDIVLASIVEREAAGDTDRALIAGIYKNRLKIGMKLEADPTVRYGKDDLAIAKMSMQEQSEYKFWGAVKTSDFLTVESPYNTYLSKGLPPTPICNPGLKSIEAVMNPTESDYLYFLHKDGKIYPAKTAAEHDLNRQKILGAKI